MEHGNRSHGSDRSYRSGGKKCGSEPQSTRAGGQDDGSYTNSFKLTLIRERISRVLVTGVACIVAEAKSSQHFFGYDCQFHCRLPAR